MRPTKSVSEEHSRYYEVQRQWSEPRKENLDTPFPPTFHGTPWWRGLRELVITAARWTAAPQPRVVLREQAGVRAPLGIRPGYPRKHLVAVGVPVYTSFMGR